MNATIERFNRLVEEFDESTSFNFDRETDLSTLALAAACWPSCRRGLAVELTVAAEAVRTAGTRVGDDFNRAFDILTSREPRDAGRDDWRADR